MSLFRDCAKCGLPVHNKSKACKACGGPSPWAATDSSAEPEAVAPEPPAAAVGALAAAVSSPLRIVESTAVDLNPSDTEVASFIHDLTAPDAELEAARIAEVESRNGPHVFLDKFSCMVGPTMAHFKAGQVIGDFALLQALKAEDAPIVPATMAPGMECCPKCRHVFRVRSVVPVKRAG
jgi:hypothetical protein